MTINRMICKAGLGNNPNKPLKSIDFITIHTTGNYSVTATSKNRAVYVSNGSGNTQASYHYVVDSAEIWQLFEDTQGCWHCGDGGDGTGNTTSVGIEICVNEKLGFKKACDNAAWLTATLLKRYSLAINRVVQHNKWSGKNCPAELRSGAWGITWVQFLELVNQYMSVSPSPTSALYRIQLGVYSVKSNADEILIKVKAAGFSDAFLAPLGDNKLYLVQVGAFSVKSNADATLAKIKTAGFADAFIKI